MERFVPHNDVDIIDERIRLGRERATILREIRAQFENVMNGEEMP
jgi:hypothetical protein